MRISSAVHRNSKHGCRKLASYSGPRHTLSKSPVQNYFSLDATISELPIGGYFIGMVAAARSIAVASSCNCGS